ncbi:hypothetical protein OC835_001431 [Tilletia horrida]|nr:hypothetical protein OC835_001431 [Tilletia horrida]
MSSDSGAGGPAAVDGVFIATFHVRAGNSLSFVHPPELHADLGQAHSEWKALPSGSHAVERDTIFFALSPARTAVACFRNVALAADDDQEQRGARMLSVGAVFSTNSAAPPSQHLLLTLERTADHVASAAHEGSDQPQRLLRDWLRNANGHGAQQLQQGDEQTPAELFQHSALSHLPALSASLGPLLPPLLKRLATGYQRLLIYSTAPLHPAACLAYNLADITQAARRQADSSETTPLHVRGLVTLHDIVTLEEEGRHRDSSSPGWIAFTSDKILLDKCSLFDILLDLTPLQMSGGNKAAASPRNQPGPSSTPASSGTKPRLSIVFTAPASASPRPQLKLKDSSWTTQEYAEMRLVEEKVRRRLDSPSALSPDTSSLDAPSSPTPPAEDAVLAARRVTAVRNRKTSQQSLRSAQAHAQPEIRPRPRPVSSLQARPRGIFLNLISLLRYVFAQTLWFFPSAFWTPSSASTSALALLGPSHTPGGRRRGARAAISGLSAETASLADSAFILPLGVRPDGGLRASVMLDDDEDEDANDEDGVEDDENEGGEVGPGSEAGSAADRSSSATLRPPTTPGTGTSSSRQRLIDVDADEPSARPISRHAAFAAAAALENDAEAPGSPDPFLAACGASNGILGSSSTSNGGGGGGDGPSSSGISFRKRNSHASVLSSSSAARLSSALQPAAPILPNSSAILSDDDDDDDDGGEEREGDVVRALAHALRDAWVDWLAVLFVEINALVSSSSGGGGGGGGGSASSTRAVVELDGTDLASIGLSTRNAADCELVRAVGRGIVPDGGDVLIRTGWAWSNLFR